MGIIIQTQLLSKQIGIFTQKDFELAFDKK